MARIARLTLPTLPILALALLMLALRGLAACAPHHHGHDGPGQPPHQEQDCRQGPCRDQNRQQPGGGPSGSQGLAPR